MHFANGSIAGQRHAAKQGKESTSSQDSSPTMEGSGGRSPAQVIAISRVGVRP